MGKLALVMIVKDENAGVIRNVAALRDHVDEIVIVDSSSPANYELLRAKLRPFDVKLRRVIPTGYADIMRSYAMAVTDSDYVLYLDADELPSPSLVQQLDSLAEYDAYWVPRFEEAFGIYTYHLRIYRKKAVRHRGANHETPLVSGVTAKLSKSSCINHEVSLFGYFTDNTKARYILNQCIIDSYQRIYTGLRISRIAPPPLNKFITQSNEALPRPMVRLIIEYDYFSTFLRVRNRTLASVNRRYALARDKFFRSLSSSEREVRLAIAKEVEASGGPTSYLGLGDVQYVEELSSTFDWKLSGVQVYEQLLRYKHYNRTRLRSFQDLEGFTVK
jgi:glycosyltransferase involved in cell wall biosynthesis